MNSIIEISSGFGRLADAGGVDPDPTGSGSATLTVHFVSLTIDIGFGISWKIVNIFSMISLYQMVTQK